MDDPWANAWGEPAKQGLEPQTTSAPSQAPSYTRHDDEETDIALPSWATGAGIQWSNPSDTQSSLWTQPSPVRGWEASPYDSIAIGKVSLPDLPVYAPPRSPSPEPVDITPPSPLLHSPSPPPPVEPAPLDSPTTDQLSLQIPQLPSPTLESPSRSIPGSPDVFGTFESGLGSADVDPWTPSRSTFAPTSADSNAWGAAWGPPVSSPMVQETDEPVDEWELAKLQKEKQDRQVPPELLTSILRQLEELSSDLWPDPNPSDPDKKIPDEPDVQRNWRIGMEGVEGLTAVVNRLVPEDLTLPPTVHFTKTFTSKRMADALRLTRHVPLTGVSPMAQYVASKGSTAWETSVKSRPVVIQDDVSPPGWRVVEKGKDEQMPENDTKKKTSGGLLSFFGRRATPPISDKSSHANSPVRAPSKPPAITPAVPSPVPLQPGVDGIKAIPMALPDPAVPAPPPVTTSPTTPIQTASSPPVMLPSTSTAKPAQTPQPEISREPTPPPSAVSRFFNRFTRPKPTVASNQHNSLALSSNDLEFLSDIAPNAQDEAHSSLQLQALSSMIESSPLPTKLPPPLAPPPKPAQPNRVSLNGNRGSSQGSPSASKPPTNDFVSLFDSGPIMKPSAPLAPPHTSSPIVLSPPLSPTLPSLSGPEMPPVFPTQNINSVRTDFSSLSSHDGTADRSLSPPFGFPPPRSSRTHTPIPPPPKRTQTAIMSTSSITPPKSNSSFRFPPPPSSRTQTPIIGPPPSASRSLMPTNAVPPPIPPPTQAQAPAHPLSLFDNDDDFSDLHSPPLQSADTHISTTYPHDSSFSASVSSDRDLFSTSSNTSVSNPTDPFDDFDDFVSSTLRTPSPPRPPAKMPPFVPKPAPPSSRTASPAPQPVPKRKISRAANHSRTMSLLDTAAAHSGSWPAPPSPLPTALPPPGAPAHNPFELDIFSGDGSGSTIAAQPTNAAAGLTTSTSSPAALAPRQGGNDVPLQFSFPPPSNGMLSSSSPPVRALSPAGLSKQPVRPPALANLPPPASAKPGGLSAQDLSFFEGL